MTLRECQHIRESFPANAWYLFGVSFLKLNWNHIGVWLFGWFYVAHLNLSISLSTEDFLWVLRFVGLYKRPHSNHLNNGINFVRDERRNSDTNREGIRKRAETRDDWMGFPTTSNWDALQFKHSILVEWDFLRSTLEMNKQASILIDQVIITLFLYQPGTYLDWWTLQMDAHMIVYNFMYAVKKR